MTEDLPYKNIERFYPWWLVKGSYKDRVATTPGNSWKLLETPGIGIYSWKTLLKNEKIKKNSWKTPENFFNIQMKKNYILML